MILVRAVSRAFAFSGPASGSADDDSGEDHGADDVSMLSHLSPCSDRCQLVLYSMSPRGFGVGDEPAAPSPSSRTTEPLAMFPDENATLHTEDSGLRHSEAAVFPLHLSF